MAPREVDERDTRWERSTLDLRVFIQDSRAWREVFDIDGVSLGEAHEWAQSRADTDSAIAIALRFVDERGRPGLIWLVEDPLISGASNGDSSPAIAFGA
ncbi:hypothetical protein [Microbacterium sp.]|uniref:hypothetical protein n=1 Tax=Microbacterium sp. TaxID=51671 RepID=UPI002811E6D9|nr:hypothetical protein [Microbacterium sp.]